MRSSPERAKAPAVPVTRAFTNNTVEQLNPNMPPASRQRRTFDDPTPCARCGRTVKVALLVVVLLHPSQPVTIRKGCIACGAEFRYASEAGQRSICSAIAERVREEVSA
jgi:hypothetical protein